MVKGISLIKKVNLVVFFQKVQETLHHAVGVLRVSVIPVSQVETLGNRTSQDTEQNSREMPKKKINICFECPEFESNCLSVCMSSL